MNNNPNDIEIIQESYGTDAETIKHLEQLVVSQHSYIMELESKIKTLQELNNVLMGVKQNIVNVTHITPQNRSDLFPNSIEDQFLE